jgi:hypothetical protein
MVLTYFIIKSKMMGWAVHVAGMEITVYKVSVENS